MFNVPRVHSWFVEQRDESELSTINQERGMAKPWGEPFSCKSELKYTDLSIITDKVMYLTVKGMTYSPYIPVAVQVTCMCYL